MSFSSLPSLLIQCSKLYTSEWNHSTEIPNQQCNEHSHEQKKEQRNEGDNEEEEYYVNTLFTSSIMRLHSNMDHYEQSEMNGNGQEMDLVSESENEMEELWTEKKKRVMRKNELRKTRKAIDRIGSVCSDDWKVSEQKMLRKNIGMRFFPFDVQEKDLLSRSIGPGGQKMTKQAKIALKKDKKLARRKQRFTGAFALAVNQPIDESNVGHKLLKKMGWSEGRGLGVNEQGRLQPIPVQLKNNKAGVGSVD